MPFLFSVLTRSVFTARKPDYTNPNWIRVGLAFGSTIALWTLVSNTVEVNNLKNTVSYIIAQVKS